MSHRRPFILIAVTMIFVSVLAFSFVAEAKPSGGNNKLNAKSCQGTGYLNLYRQNGTGFANADECASYAAKGGVLATATAAPTLTPTPSPTLTPTPPPVTPSITMTFVYPDVVSTGPCATVHLLNFTPSTSYTAEYWSKTLNPDIPERHDSTFTIATEPDGSAKVDVAMPFYPYAQIRIAHNGVVVVSDWTFAVCI